MVVKEKNQTLVRLLKSLLVVRGEKRDKEEDVEKVNKMPIRKVKGGWKIDNVNGLSPTHKKAQQRLRAIKARQRKK